MSPYLAGLAKKPFTVVGTTKSILIDGMLWAP